MRGGAGVGAGCGGTGKGGGSGVEAGVLEPEVPSEVPSGRLPNQIKATSPATATTSFRPHPALVGGAAGLLGAAMVFEAGVVDGAILLEVGRGVGRSGAAGVGVGAAGGTLR